MPWWRRWAFYKGLIEILGLCGLGFYCFVTYKQWSDLGHNFETDERAWISPSFAWNSDKIFAEGDGYIPGKMFDGDAIVRITNSGKLPIFRTESQIWVEVLTGC
jgi:hypothetical protein